MSVPPSLKRKCQSVTTTSSLVHSSLGIFVRVCVQVLVSLAMWQRNKNTLGSEKLIDSE